jgi:hypothetical protein
VADPLVIHADLEAYLTAWYRAALAARAEAVCAGVEVGNKEPAADDFPEKLVVIRDLGGPDTSLMTAERSISISVLAGSVESPKTANDLARIVHALRTQIPSADPANPVAAVIDSNGPYAVPEDQDRARRLITMTLAVVPSLL